MTTQNLRHQQSTGRGESQSPATTPSTTTTPTTTATTPSVSSSSASTASRAITPTSPGAAALAEPPEQRRRGVRWFLLLAFGGAWLPWLAIHLAGGSLDNVVVQLAAAAFIPALAAIAVRLWVSRQGFAGSGLRLNLKRSWRYYVAAMTIPWGVLLAALAVAAATGVWWPSLTDLTPEALITIVAGPVVCLLAAPFFWGEEYGWTAYLRDRLVPGRPVATTFLTGTIWGVWHFPLPWVGYFGGGTGVAAAFWAMLLWVPLSILLEFIIGWLWSETDSVWPGAMVHAGCNLVASAGMAMLIGDGVNPAVTTLLLCAGLVPFVLAIVLSGHTGGRRMIALEPRES